MLSAYVCQRDSGSEEITPLAPSTIPFLKYSTSLLYQMSLNQLKKVHELAFFARKPVGVWVTILLEGKIP